MPLVYDSLLSVHKMYVVIVTMNRDIARLDTRLLFAFEALAAERNVTRAAERLGLTQQGMSGQLSRMRNLFDEPFFVRAKGGVVPTPRAEELEPSVRAALVSLETLVSPGRFDPATFDGDEALAAIGRSRRIGLVVPGFSVVGALLERTDLIAVLPERMIRAMRRELETFEPPVRVTGFRLNAYWPPRLDVSPPHRWLRNEIARAAETCNVLLENRPAVPPAA